MKTTIIEQIALWGSVAGSIIIAIHVPWSGLAFIPYLLSNIASIYLLKDSNAPRVLIYQSIFFIAVNILGIGRWLL